MPRTATDQEIKLSYLRLAKTCHPDLNPGDPTATLRFQELSAAYQAIKDADSRRDHRTQASYAPQQDVSDAKATFSGVMHDMNMIYEVVSWTYDEFKLDMADLSDALQSKDYDRAKSILSDYKYAGVVPDGLLTELKDAADSAALLDARMERLHGQLHGPAAGAMRRV